MQSYIKMVLNFFFWTMVATTALSISGIVYLWFFSNGASELPYLKTLVGITILEIAAVVIMYAKKGIRYLPEVHINKTEEDTFKFMQNFVCRGSSVTIVSNRISWLNRAPNVLTSIIERAKTGTQFEIIISRDVDGELNKTLKDANVKIYVTDELPPEARFTLLNENRSGAEELAIARGAHPKHEITVFDNDSGPQIIALAKDIMRKYKSVENA